jgi:hypothetical protein
MTLDQNTLQEIQQASLFEFLRIKELKDHDSISLTEAYRSIMSSVDHIRLLMFKQEYLMHEMEKYIIPELDSDKPFFDDGEKTSTLIIQCNGRFIATVKIPKNLPEESTKDAVMSHPTVKKHLSGLTVKTIAIVPEVLANIVTAELVSKEA